MTILERILEHKRREVAEAKARLPEEVLRERAQRAAAGVRPRFKEALVREGRVALIAEVKKASPSKGLIRPDFDPVELARAYVRGGAAAISVLTDERFFQGSLAHLAAVREAVSVPLLRKEFIIDAYQLYEARVHGADAVLLIVAALTPESLRALLEQARALDLDALVEVHTEDEIATALSAGADLIGINNRDLRTFHTTLEVTRRLIRRTPPGIVTVSESGIAGRADVEAVGALGVNAVLVGEALARETDVVAKAAELSGKDVAP